MMAQAPVPMVPVAQQAVQPLPSNAWSAAGQRGWSAPPVSLGRHPYADKQAHEHQSSGSAISRLALVRLAQTTE